MFKIHHNISVTPSCHPRLKHEGGARDNSQPLGETYWNRMEIAR